MTVGGTVYEPSKEWKAWHESLKHDNPSNVREAVENILFDAIDFGGDMGPNGNVWSGVDEGDVLTEKCIDGWVRSIESVAATVGVGTCKDLGGTGADGEDVFNCSECGCVLSLYDGQGVNTLCTSFIYDYPRFCPECGAKVVSE